MNFIWYNLLLLMSWFLAAGIFAVVLLVTLYPMALLGNLESPNKLVTYPLLGISGAVQIYFWGLWAAYCVAVTYRYLASGGSWWLYFIFGFFWCISLLRWLHSREQRSAQSWQEGRKIQFGARFYKLLAAACFILFAFRPGFIDYPFGWALDLVM